MNRLSKIALFGALSLSATAVNAADFVFSGNIAYQNDVVFTNFTLNTDATNVAVWTDSFMSAINFDPITALWRQQGSDYVLVDQNDDDDSISPSTQTYYDSGFALDSLAAGNYLFSVAAYSNFAAGSMLSDGFDYDSDSPIPLSEWCQPASHCNMGTFWRVNLSGVDSASNEPPPSSPAVPEPSIWLMMLAGMGAIGGSLRYRSRAPRQVVAG